LNFWNFPWGKLLPISNFPLSDFYKIKGSIVSHAKFHRCHSYLPKTLSDFYKILLGGALSPKQNFVKKRLRANFFYQKLAISAILQTVRVTTVKFGVTDYTALNFVKIAQGEIGNW